ncbi:hypothetical protein FDP41_000221 [Naegleria fowleri]|uniref:CHY-type domain-containing protein n=1 Tax=Naegleria fowleri TaxID=5763 RepID=A0A6A5CDK5_NAEFO|nr:uncharacterized protein FDP41_000221 [Naegleria fowleri]KAF0985182.1 hypothetical protein FDP41_000221 [Naegleria fowleri]CAG4713549.1 unnamed protein product [Naegleria fowleri]
MNISNHHHSSSSSPQASSLAKDELLQLRSKYKFKVLSEKGKWPLQFSLLHIPDIDIKIDPSMDGLIFVFEITEMYPTKSDFDSCKLIRIENYTPTEKSPKLAPVMLQNMIQTCQKQLTKIIISNTSEMITKFMNWENANITTIILNGNMEYFTSYLAEGMHGISERRYQIDFSKYPKESINSEDQDDEIPELDFYSLDYPPPELLESNSSDTLLLLPAGCELKNASIFEMKQLSFIVKCDRCQNDCEMRELKAGQGVEKSCPKCAKTLSVCMKPFGMTESSLSTEGKKGNEIQAGCPFVYLETTNCTFLDIIPKGNILEVLCFNCSHGNQMKNLKIKSPNEMHCAYCHHLISIQLLQIQKKTVGEYLAMITHNAGQKYDDDSKSSAVVKKKKHKALKGIHPGAPLPLFGTCEHYKNSKRWFRFDCCGRAYPCDICHEKECEAAVSEQMAKKMICGYCSHEQGLSETCHFCKKNLIKKITDKSSAGGSSSFKKK